MNLLSKIVPPVVLLFDQGIVPRFIIILGIFNRGEPS